VFFFFFRGGLLIYVYDGKFTVQHLLPGAGECARRAEVGA